MLHWACVGGYSNVVEVLLQEGAEVDSRNEVYSLRIKHNNMNN